MLGPVADTNETDIFTLRGFLGGVMLILAVILLVQSAPSRSDEGEGLSNLVVNPSFADAEVIEALPQLGPARVNAIVQSRQGKPFESIDELHQRVRGIGPATLRAIDPHLRFDN
jgi:DNA uptake protein ComE-like DNA-binding protein